ncbi:MAG: Rieske (2Fe-2S) protein [Phycisphaeraceae bacterium]
MSSLPVCPVHDLPPGHRRLVTAPGNISIGVFNVNGRFYALRNICPHRKAPLCRGQVTGRVTSSGPGDAQMHGSDQILRCPWHGWEFDITTGESVFNPHKVRVKTYPVTVETAAECTSEGETGYIPLEDEPAIETYPVTVEDGTVTVLLSERSRST